MRIMEERSSVFAYGGLAAIAAAGLGAIGLVFAALFVALEITILSTIEHIAIIGMLVCLMMTAWALSLLGEARSRGGARILMALGVLGLLGDTICRVLFLINVTLPEGSLSLETLEAISYVLIGIWLVGSNLLARAAPGMSGVMSWVGIFAGALFILNAGVPLFYSNLLAGIGELIGVPLWAVWLGRGLITGRIRPVT